MTANYTVKFFSSIPFHNRNVPSVVELGSPARLSPEYYQIKIYELLVSQDLMLLVMASIIEDINSMGTRMSGDEWTLLLYRTRSVTLYLA